MAKDIEGLVTYSVKCQGTAIGPPRENPIPWQEMKKTIESSVFRFRQSHQWSNLSSFVSKRIYEVNAWKIAHFSSKYFALMITTIAVMFVCTFMSEFVLTLEFV